MQATLTIDGAEHTVTFDKIGGRGDVGNVNWGSSGSLPFEDADAIADDLRGYVGQPLLLTGGGGSGYDVVRLLDVIVSEWEDGYLPKAEVSIVCGTKLARTRRGETFTPWIDSWQLSVPDDPRAMERLVSRVVASA